MQCCHEICILAKFRLNFFGTRWLNDLTYNELYCNPDKLLNFNNIRNVSILYTMSGIENQEDENIGRNDSVQEDDIDTLPLQELSYQSVHT